MEHYAKKNNFQFVVDSVGNILVKIPATRGHETKPTIIIQNHMDMVCVKKEGYNHDFKTDPIQLIRDSTGRWIKANFTTLGADNGIGMAHSLALGIDPKINHGPLELLFTVEEETTFKGVDNLSPKWLSGKYLINIDSSWVDGITIGSSGGIDVEHSVDVKFEFAPSHHKLFTIKVFGMIGGHSTVDINKNRANAIKIMVRILNHLSTTDDLVYRLISLISNSESGIPNYGSIYISMNPNYEKLLKTSVENFMKKIKLEYSKSDPRIDHSIESQEKKLIRVLRSKDEKNVMKILQEYPDGVLAMEPDYPDTVQTSVCLSGVIFEDGEFTIESSISSSKSSAIDDTIAKIKRLIKLVEGTTETSNPYPAWIPKLDSKLLEVAKKSYLELFGEVVKLSAIHGGLETGVIGSKYPKLEMIAMGSMDENAHTIEERVEISSVKRSYDLLCKIVESLE